MASCNLFLEEDVRRGERIAQSTVWKVYKGSFGDNACAIKRLKSINEQDKNSFRSNVLPRVLYLVDTRQPSHRETSWHLL